jgi:nicotinamidase-related amidase
MITAGDLYVRNFELFVPSDCVAALTEEDQLRALELMEESFDAKTTPSEQLNLSDMCNSGCKSVNPSSKRHIRV